MSSGVSRILIADDHEIVLRGLRILFETQPDLEVVAECSDADTVVELAMASGPDIAIIDYLAPFDGPRLLAELKRRLPKLKVLIYTMHDSEDAALEMIAAGASGYVLKSETEQHLLAAVRALASHRPYVGLREAGSLLDRLPGQKSGKLTPRELEVVHLLARGLINPEVARDLNISIKTVETHRSSIMHKLGLKNTAELVRYAIRNHIIDA
ncbi:MAG: response regulator transcription factor [Sphingomonadales bacterium]|nr:MAG: response regulator transcription factor [Sphingomonadales bacterium]